LTDRCRRPIREVSDAGQSECLMPARQRLSPIAAFASGTQQSIEETAARVQPVRDHRVFEDAPTLV